MNTSRSGAKRLVLATQPSSLLEEARGLPSWNGSSLESIMDRGGLDLRNLEGFLPFQFLSLPDRVDPLTRLWRLPIIGVTCVAESKWLS
jgi:hypothetical protein